MGAWEDGFAAGWRAGISQGSRFGHTDIAAPMPDGRRASSRGKAAPAKKPRKASAANKRYGAAFKRLAPKYKKKSGGWKKDGFKRCAAAARKEAKR